MNINLNINTINGLLNELIRKEQELKSDIKLNNKQNDKLSYKRIKEVILFIRRYEIELKNLELGLPIFLYLTYGDMLGNKRTSSIIIQQDKQDETQDNYLYQYNSFCPAQLGYYETLPKIIDYIMTETYYSNEYKIEIDNNAYTYVTDILQKALFDKTLHNIIVNKDKDKLIKYSKAYYKDVDKDYIHFYPSFFNKIDMNILKNLYENNIKQDLSWAL